MNNVARHRLLAMIVLVLSGSALAACGATTPTSAPTTTAARAAASTPATTATSGASGGTAAPAGASTSRAVVCDDLRVIVERNYGNTIESMTELGGICTATMTGGDRIELLWNRVATNETSFATTTRGLDPVDVPGATVAAGDFDEMGARAKVLIAGKGSWELSLTPEFSASRATAQADLDTLTRIATALIAQGLPA